MDSSAVQTAGEGRRWDCALQPTPICEPLCGAATTPKRPSSVRLGLDRQVVTCLSFAMTDVFEALAAPARRAILDVLCERDGQTLFEICTRLTMKHDLTLTRQAISQHLDVLEAAGLLRTEREGRYKYHYLDTTPLNAIVKRWLTPKRKAGEE
jgi:DNA-binding transcriptional ArsR family regulator